MASIQDLESATANITNLLTQLQASISALQAKGSIPDADVQALVNIGTSIQAIITQIG